MTVSIGSFTAFWTLLIGVSFLSTAQEGPDVQSNKIGMEFVKIDPGTFRMGCSAGDLECLEHEKPEHEVRLTKGFEIGKYEVMQSEWRSVIGGNPSHFQGDRRPVEQVNPQDVQDFLRKMNEWNDGYRYRLPTEAEWEYAARAGSAAPYVSTADSSGWYRDNSSGQTQPVGQKQPNRWGLYDVTGNVWERVSDRPGNYTPGSVTNPTGAAFGDRLLRGGAWDSVASDLRVSSRAVSGAIFANFDIGFRCVRERLR